MLTKRKSIVVAALWLVRRKNRQPGADYSIYQIPTELMERGGIAVAEIGLKYVYK